MALILGRMTFSMRPSKWKKKEQRKFRETGIMSPLFQTSAFAKLYPKGFSGVPSLHCFERSVKGVELGTFFDTSVL